MFFIIRLLISIASFFAVAIGLALLLGFVVNLDDLATCKSSPDANNLRCMPADAIVAISGGDTAARTKEAIKLYQAGWAPQLIFSGAAQDKSGISNAAAMQLQAENAGVNIGNTTIEEDSVDTADNARKIKQIVNSKNIHRIILVTSPYHQRRASIEFGRALGPAVQVINHPTPDDSAWPANWWLTPGGWWLAISETAKTLFVMAGGA